MTGRGEAHRRVSNVAATLVGVVLLVLCGAIAGAVSIWISGVGGVATGILLPMVLFLGAIRWCGVRMLLGLFVGACGAVFIAFSAQYGLRVALGEDAGEVSVTEAPGHPEAVSFDFVDAYPRTDLIGSYLDPVSDETYYHYAFPLVPEGWTRDDPVAVWVFTHEEQPSPELLRRACDKHIPEGCAELGSVYEGERDLGSALSLYQQACDGGSALGCFRLGRMYQRGIGRDPDRARSLFDRTCRGGIREACASDGR